MDSLKELFLDLRIIISTLLLVWSFIVYFISQKEKNQVLEYSLKLKDQAADYYKQINDHSNKIDSRCDAIEKSITNLECLLSIHDLEKRILVLEEQLKHLSK